MRKMIKVFKIKTDKELKETCQNLFQTSLLNQLTLMNKRQIQDLLNKKLREGESRVRKFKRLPKVNHKQKHYQLQFSNQWIIKMKTNKRQNEI